VVTPADLRQIYREKAYRRLALYDSYVSTRAARDAFSCRFERKVDSDRVLSENERQRRAECAKKVYFLRHIPDR
jgi:hypothetical protein